MLHKTTLLSLLCSLVLLVPAAVAGQGTISITDGPYPLPALSREQPSVFIHPLMDTAALTYVATFRAQGKDSLTVPGELFLQTKTQARAHGANAFRLMALQYDSIRRPVITLAAYRMAEQAIQQNIALYPTNTIYIFSAETSRSDTFLLRINDQTRSFGTRTYLRYVLQEDQSLKLSKGGFTGARANLHYRAGKPPIYLMAFGGPRPAGGPVPAPGTIGMSFTTGQISEMTDDYGQFLVLILQEAH